MSRLPALFVMLAWAPSARAADEKEPLDPTPAYAVGLSDAVVLGRIVKIEKGTVNLKSEWNPDEKVAHRVAILEVETGIEGAKDKEQLKVAFLVKATDYSGSSYQVEKPRPLVLKAGQKGLFYLSRREDNKDYYRAPAELKPVESTAKRYDQKVADAKAAVAAIADPTKALTAAVERDRLAAASAVVLRLRWRDHKPVPADLTRLVMKAVLEVDWARNPDSKDPLPYSMSGPGLATLLDLKPGETLSRVKPKTGESDTEAWKKAVAAWYEKAGDKVEIKPFVIEKK